MVSLAGIGAIGSAVGGLIGGSKDADAQEEANRINRKFARKSIKNQRKFAKKGVRWKTRDATKAGDKYGIHPLALLGMQTHSFSPVSAGQQAYTGRASTYSQAGQDIGGALAANTPTSRQQRAQDAAIASLAVERAGLENQLLKTQIASQIRTMMQPGRGPGHPSRTVKQGETVPSTIRVSDKDGNEYDVAAPIFPDPEQDLYRQYKEDNLVEENLPHIRKQILKAPADILGPIMDFIIPYLPEPIDWNRPPQRPTKGPSFNPRTRR